MCTFCCLIYQTNGTASSFARQLYSFYPRKKLFTFTTKSKKFAFRWKVPFYEVRCFYLFDISGFNFRFRTLITYEWAQKLHFRTAFTLVCTSWTLRNILTDKILVINTNFPELMWNCVKFYEIIATLILINFIRN